MPDFFVQATGSPALVNAPWIDPASVTRPSRVTNQNDRTYRRINATVGTTLTLRAIPYGYLNPQADSLVGLFTMWPLEVPTGNGMPVQSIPTAGMSAVQTFVLNRVGHYTFIVRHEDTITSPLSVAGGFVVLHFESIAAP
ncbi:MAG: hypothetical protein WC565_04890 [Parcubacteria group bacterium]